MTPKAVFFDIGNTIISVDLRDFWVPYLQRSGAKVDWAKLPEAVPLAFAHYVAEHDNATTVEAGMQLWQEFDRILLHHLDAEDVEHWVSQLFVLRQDRHSWPLLPGAREVLTSLHTAGISLVAVSNWSADLPEILKIVGLDSVFCGIVSSASVGASKPRPEIFARALEIAGVSAADTWHVGDSWQADVLGAQAMGITPVWLGPEPRPGALHISELSALPNLLGVS
jgi:HAD superfamily hydrolase (TIGR01509 family)